MFKIGVPLTRRLIFSKFHPVASKQFVKPLFPPPGFQSISTTSTKFNLTNLKSIFSRNYATHNQYNPKRRATSFRFGRSGVSSNLNPNQRRNMSILAPTAFAFGFSAIIYYASPYLFNYTPLRYFKKHPSHLVWAIVGMNVAVFGLWQIQYSNGSLYRLLNDYFLLNMKQLSSKTYLQMIGSGWSHKDFMHLLVNMGCLYSFSSTMISTLGVANFTSLYMIAGLFSSLASIYSGTLGLSAAGLSLGASGSISGVFAMFATLFPKAGVSLFVFPIPGGASMALLGYTLFNVAGLVMRYGGLDYAGHLGGTLVGAVYGWYALSKLKASRRRGFW